MSIDYGGGDQIRFERVGRAGVVTLTRPKSLNALTHTMVKALSRALADWEGDSDIAVVVLRAEGRAFCAGGDILHVYEARQRGGLAVDFFADEYRLNAQIARFTKPYVALMDGLVMGGGVGIACHGSYRVMTENAVFAMPEVGIGFFPDVGGSHLLPDLGENFGLYLGLTGSRIRYGDALWSGIATHTVKSELLPGLFQHLSESGDPDLALRAAFSPAQRETAGSALRAIAGYFSKRSVKNIVDNLRAAAVGGDEQAAGILATMAAKSPTSLAVTFKSITRGSTMSMDDCMRMEFRILNRMVRGHDFYEGIRAALVDRDSAPKWSPATLEELSEDDIEAYFAPPPDGDLTF